MASSPVTSCFPNPFARRRPPSSDERPFSSSSVQMIGPESLIFFDRPVSPSAARSRFPTASATRVHDDFAAGPSSSTSLGIPPLSSNNHPPAQILHDDEEFVFVQAAARSSLYETGQSEILQHSATARALASINAVRILFYLSARMRGNTLLRELPKQSTLSMVTSICATWTDQTTIDIQEILNLPIFVQSLENYAFEYTVPSQDGITSLLNNLQRQGNGTQCAAAVLSRPPFALAALYIPSFSALPNMFAVFNPQPQSGHDGPAFVFFPSLLDAAMQISFLLTARTSTNGFAAQPQAEGDCSTYMFVSRQADNGDFVRYLYEANVGLLSTKMRLRRTEAERARGEERINALEERVRELERGREEPRRQSRDLPERPRMSVIREAEPSNGAEEIVRRISAPLPVRIVLRPRSSSFGAEREPERETHTHHHHRHHDDAPGPSRRISVVHAPPEPESQEASFRPISSIHELRLPPPPPSRKGKGRVSQRPVTSPQIDPPRDHLPPIPIIRPPPPPRPRHAIYVPPEPFVEDRYPTPARIRPPHRHRERRPRHSTPAFNQEGGRNNTHDAPTSDDDAPVRMFDRHEINRALIAQELHDNRRRQADLRYQEVGALPGPSRPPLNTHGRRWSAEAITTPPTQYLDPFLPSTPPLPSGSKRLPDIPILIPAYLYPPSPQFSDPPLTVSPRSDSWEDLRQVCGICFEDLPQDVSTFIKIQGCGHDFCQDCTKRHVVTSIGDNRYPVQCPTCAADEQTNDPGQITEEIVGRLGLSAAELEAWTELSLASLIVTVTCPGCQTNLRVDREDYNESSTLWCPLPGCSRMWCKMCTKVLRPGAPTHVCEAAVEFEKLVEQRRWKRCPGCGIVVEKNGGCNHMTCPGRGCNTHFCWMCGLNITQSTNRHEISNAMDAHFRSSDCNVFEFT